MENKLNLDELLDYGEEYYYPKLIDSDYFTIDKRKKVQKPMTNQQNNASSNDNSNSNSENTSNQGNEQNDSYDDKVTNSQNTQEQNKNNQDETNSKEKTSESFKQKKDTQSPSESNQDLQENSSDITENQKFQKDDNKANSVSSEQQIQNEQAQNKSETESNNQAIRQNDNQQNINDSDINSENLSQYQDKKQDTSKSNETNFEQQNLDNQKQNNSETKSPTSKSNEKFTDQQIDDNQTSTSEKQQSAKEKITESKKDNENNQKQNELKNEPTSAQEKQEPAKNSDKGHQQLDDDFNDFDDLINNYEKSSSDNIKQTNGYNSHQASSKLSSIKVTKIYKVLRKLVSLSYERYQKGTYKYNKKEIVKHYLTDQKFKIIDDLESPSFKPDVYVFDLSPSNNESLEMYVNAISSVAIKGSWIYLTYNDQILRKLIIKKGTHKELDINNVVNSNTQKFENFDCLIYTDYRSLYDELKNIKNRKIYIFSDFDIMNDMIKLSQVNNEIIWFSTAKKNYGFYYQSEPSGYLGYYVDTMEIDDIEKYILEKNKLKYKMGGK